MQKRHTLHGAAHRISVRDRTLSNAPPGESGARIRGAGQTTASVEDNIQASIDSAMDELDMLEMPFRASAPPLSAPPAPQQMPRGMPPLPFQAPHPKNMPPLPVALKVMASMPASSPANDAVPLNDAKARPSRWWLFLALAMGVVCLSGALWLQLH